VAERPLGTDDTVAGTSSFTDSGMPVPQVVGGRYQILGLLGSGGMGSVYRARDSKLDEIVALKLLRRELLDAPAMLARFRQEVKLARRVTHTNVARVFDIGEDGADKFLTMEYVDGEPLSTVIARRGALPLEELRTFCRALVSGLSAAHVAGVVHRDLKPDNILVAQNGRVVITDFGIARAFLDGEHAGRTQGGLLGTPAYMAPEQVEGLDDVDERADLYALGCVLFELATGERAWRGDAVLAVAAARLTQPPPDPRVRRPLPDGLAEVIVRCLARRRENRPASAARVGDLLEAAFDSVSRWTPPPAQKQPLLPLRSDKSVAVLPFKNGGPPSEDYVAEGFTEDLIDTLSMTRGLRVRPHSVVAQLQRDDPRAIGRSLDVQVIVEGSLKKNGDRTRVSARAIHVEDGFQIWAYRFDAAPGDLLMISDRMAHAIAAALTVELTGRPTSARQGPSDPAAIELYLRARRELRNTWNGDPRAAVELFDRAVDRAPDDANILANRALALTRAAFMYGGAPALEAAHAAAERAVAVAPQLGESWAALASVRLYRGDTAVAAEALRMGLQRAPTSARLHQNVAWLQAEVGLLDSARRHFETALRLDSSLVDVRWDLARLLASQGDWAQADELLDTPVDDDAAYLSRTIARARLSIWRARTVDIPADLGDRIDANSLMVRLLKSAQASQLAGAIAPDTLERIQVMAAPQRRRLSSFLWQLYCEVCGSIGDIPRVLDGISRALDVGLFDSHWMQNCPSLAGARADPGFAPLAARVEANAAPIRAVFDDR
jgi:serine/threonine-protein kinase